MMEVYDYTVHGSAANELYTMVDQMSAAECAQALGILQEFRKKEETDHSIMSYSLFDSFILPVLKNFAKESVARLEIDRRGDNTVMIALFSDEVFEITSEDLPMRAVWLLASRYMVADAGDGKASFSLVFTGVDGHS